MTRRDVLTRAAPCGDDCAEESFPIPGRTRRTPLGWRLAFWGFLLILFSIAAWIVVTTILADDSEAQTPDSGAVILLVANYWPDSANIFVQADSGFQSVGRFAPGSRALVVLPSASLGRAALLRLIASPIIAHYVMFELEPIIRNTDGQPTARQIQVGDPPKPKEGQQS